MFKRNDKYSSTQAFETWALNTMTYYNSRRNYGTANPKQIETVIIFLTPDGAWNFLLHSRRGICLFELRSRCAYMQRKRDMRLKSNKHDWRIPPQKVQERTSQTKNNSRKIIYSLRGKFPKFRITWLATWSNKETTI